MLQAFVGHCSLLVTNFVLLCAKIGHWQTKDNTNDNICLIILRIFLAAQEFLLLHKLHKIPYFSLTLK